MSKHSRSFKNMHELQQQTARRPRIPNRMSIPFSDFTNTSPSCLSMHVQTKMLKGLTLQTNTTGALSRIMRAPDAFMVNGSWFLLLCWLAMSSEPNQAQ